MIIAVVALTLALLAYLWEIPLRLSVSALASRWRIRWRRWRVRRGVRRINRMRGR